MAFEVLKRKGVQVTNRKTKEKQTIFDLSIVYPFAFKYLIWEAMDINAEF